MFTLDVKYKSGINLRDLIFLSLSPGAKTKKKQHRKRIIIQLPANGGQDCPEVLTQERECEAQSVCNGYR